METPSGTRPGTGDSDLLVAYFCSEFGIRPSLPIYAGGLGVLAGDQLKAAADLGVPLVGVGLFYRQGYFDQELADGGQVERYPVLDPAALGLTLELDLTGDPVRAEVDLAGEPVGLHAWRLDLGGVRLYLLDTDVEGNSESARLVAGALYGGDREHRLRQEIVLGIGGVRMLAALGLAPTVFHMNEGHAALLSLERVRLHVQEGLELAEALDHVRATTVFTTHTPVPAGNDAFDPELVRRYLERLVGEAQMSFEELFQLARSFEGDPLFGMTPLALRTSASANGVSALHGRVAREMWAPIWPDRPVGEVPIGQVTNGVHPGTWLAAGLRDALERAGVRPNAAPAEQHWERAAEIGAAELWSLHVGQRHALVESVLRRTRRRLDPHALTIVFARRFATYKRAALLLSDPDRLSRLLLDRDRPVQLVVAGKAHPADEPGKSMLRQVTAFGDLPTSGGRVVFVENYDMEVAAALVRGADVWLNTPRRPLEASGTSGMKAALNGGLNLSVLDGWWAEAYTAEIGWAIPGDGSPNEVDALDAQELFRLLEEEVVPTFYDRDRSGLPRRWIEMMSAAIVQVGGRFTAQRMVAEYADRYYRPASRSSAAASSGGIVLT